MVGLKSRLSSLQTRPESLSTFVVDNFSQLTHDLQIIYFFNCFCKYAFSMFIFVKSNPFFERVFKTNLPWVQFGFVWSLKMFSDNENKLEKTTRFGKWFAHLFCRFAKFGQNKTNYEFKYVNFVQTIFSLKLRAMIGSLEFPPSLRNKQPKFRKYKYSWSFCFVNFPKYVLI